MLASGLVGGVTGTRNKPCPRLVAEKIAINTIKAQKKAILKANSTYT